MSDLDLNLAAGMETIRYVKGLMKYGAKNKVKDIFRSKGESITCVENLKVQIAGYQDSLMELHNSNPRTANERMVEFSAASAATYGCGNCEEQARLAFIYLRNKGIFPVEILQKPNIVPGFGGHAFVVIGRDEQSSSDPATWGESAVIVDPHGEEKAFPASQMAQYSSLRGATFGVLFRQNSKSDTAIRQFEAAR